MLSLNALKEHAKDISGDGSPILRQIHSPNSNCSATSPPYSPPLSFRDVDDESQMHCKKIRVQEECGNVEVIIGTQGHGLIGPTLKTMRMVILVGKVSVGYLPITLVLFMIIMRQR